MSARPLSQRERLLAIVVGTALFALANLLLADFVAKKARAIRDATAQRSADWEAIRDLIAERETWVARDEWLANNHPKLANEQVAGGEFLEEVRKAAAEKGLAPGNRQIAQGSKSPAYRSIAIETEVKGPWRAMIEFLHALQQPGRFVVIENGELQVDPEDNTKIKGTFRIARWYAP
jgi:hypothetical protein